MLSIIARGDLKSLTYAGWASPNQEMLITLSEHGDFNYCIPLKMLLGFAEEYKRILMNVKTTSAQGEPNGVLEVTKVYWKLPYMHVANAYRLRLLNKHTSLVIPFRNWELHDYPAFPATRRQAWTVKISS